MEQALKWWNHTRKDDWWRSQMPMSSETLDAALCYGRIRSMFKSGTGKRSLKRIATIIDDVEDRKLCFPNIIGSHGDIPRYLWLEPEKKKIGKLVAESFWTLWSRCLSCDHNQFLPMTIDGKPYVACYHCIPPSQYPQIGATRVEKSLIHQDLKNRY